MQVISLPGEQQWFYYSRHNRFHEIEIVMEKMSLHSESSSTLTRAYCIVKAKENCHFRESSFFYQSVFLQWL